MVVDDSLTVRRVSQRMLEKYGYCVELAKNGAHALEILRELTPAAILLDIEMPTMDGFELLSRLRADERFYSLPVAMITSRMAERHREHAMQLGANAYFGKPYREQEVVDWLSQSLSARKPTSYQQQFDQDQSLHAAA
jgi:chemosensory pili system protein ChpA (sensor histidine kinase/response regulator)